MIRKILISQPTPMAATSPYQTLIEKYQVELVFKPFFRIESLSSREFRDQKVDILSHTAIVLTSKIAADCFFKMAEELRLKMPDDMKYFCSSELVANYLQKYIQYRKRKIFFAPNGTDVELKQLILKRSKETYFVPGLEGAPKGELVIAMEEKGIKLTTASLYRKVYQDFTKEEVLSYDLLVFFSPNGVESLHENVKDYEQGNQLIATLGASTAEAVQKAGLKLAVSAPSPEYPSIVDAIESLLKA